MEEKTFLPAITKTETLTGLQCSTLVVVGDVL